MAKKVSSSSKKKIETPEVAPQVASVTPVRKTVAPRKSAPKAEASPAGVVATITHSMIAERAYHISRSANGGSEFDNWCRAEGELKRENGLI